MGAQPRHDCYAMSIAYKNNKNSFFKSSFDMKYITKLHFISFTYLAKQYLNLEYTWIMETTLQVVLILSVSHFFKNKSHCAVFLTSEMSEKKMQINFSSQLTPSVHIYRLVLNLAMFG